jgi:hypothetical protein
MFLCVNFFLADLLRQFAMARVADLADFYFLIIAILY